MENIEINYYKDFGILVFKGKRLFLNMVIDTAGSKEFPGHTHNDKLSIEVMIDGKYITRDSGDIFILLIRISGISLEV